MFSNHYICFRTSHPARVWVWGPNTCSVLPKSETRASELSCEPRVKRTHPTHHSLLSFVCVACIVCIPSGRTCYHLLCVHASVEHGRCHASSAACVQQPSAAALFCVSDDRVKLHTTYLYLLRRCQQRRGLGPAAHGCANTFVPVCACGRATCRTLVRPRAAGTSHVHPHVWGLGLGPNKHLLCARPKG